MPTKKVIVPGTIWITGISGSGKTTLSQWLKNSLQPHLGNELVMLDGDAVRAKLGNAYGYSSADRHNFALELAKLALTANQQGKIALVAAISHLRRTRKEVRELIGKFMEVYLFCPVEVCAKRDYKGHYQRALSGEYDNFIGITEPYQTSENLELMLNTADDSIDECGKVLLEHSLSFIYGETGVINSDRRR